VLVTVLEMRDMAKHAVPIVVGVGDVKNASKKVEDAREPKDLMLEAIHLALKDTGISTEKAKALQSSIDSIDVVANWTWSYPDLPHLLAMELGAGNVEYTFESGHGGNSPGTLFDDAARRISRGQSKVAIVTGGEALASRKQYTPVCYSRAITANITSSCCLRLSQKVPPTRLDKGYGRGLGHRQRVSGAGTRARPRPEQGDAGLRDVRERVSRSQGTDS
jgi:hypothetical protein